jgi:hypothetical protein
MGGDGPQFSSLHACLRPVETHTLHVMAAAAAARGCGQVPLVPHLCQRHTAPALHPCVCSCRSSVQAASQVQQQPALEGDLNRFRTSSRRLLSAADVQRAAATLEPDTVAVAADAGSAPASTSAGAASAKLRALNKRSQSSRGTVKALWRQSGQHVGAAAAAAAAAAKRGPTVAATDWIAGLQLTASQVTGVSSSPKVALPVVACSTYHTCMAKP